MQDERKSMVHTVKAQVARKPNNLQQSVAIYLMGMLTKKARAIWSLEAGCGKSRIIAFAALIALLELEVRHVHFVVPNYVLKNREMKE